MPHNYSIRHALLSDMPAAGLMLHACWMSAYPGVLDQALLSQLSPEGMCKYGGPTRAKTAAGDPVPPDICARFRYELFAIHVDPMKQ